MVLIILIRTSEEMQSGMQVSNEMNGAQTQRCLLQDSFLMSDRSSTLSGYDFNRECIGSPLKRPRALDAELQTMPLALSASALPPPT